MTALTTVSLLIPLTLQTAVAAPPAVKHGKPARAADKTTPIRMASVDDWYGILIDSQHLGYLHIEAKQVPASSPKQWDCVVDFFINPTPGNPVGVERQLHRAILRDNGATVESWRTVTSEGKTKTTHRKYTETEIRSGKSDEDDADKDESSLPADFLLPNPSKKLPKGFTLGNAEIITVDYQPISATRIILPNPKTGKGGRLWVDRDYQMIRADLDMDGTELRIERMSPASAVRLVTPLPAQQDVITPVKPLENARETRKRSYVVAGLTTLPRADSDDVEKISVIPQPDSRYTAIITVNAAPLDEKTSPTIADIDKTKFAEYLAPGKLTPASDPAMKALARQIVGLETNAARAAGRLEQWIHTNLSYDWGFSGNRSAQQTLADRRGVCQNYATLLVTLARAAGIPAKYCSGPAYSSDGKFYRHAWAECWTGKWAALEPTWGQSFADASHVKLTEGEPDAPMDAWNNSAPPTIEALAPNADIAQVIRDNTPKVADKYDPHSAQNQELAKRIQNTAALPPHDGMVIETDTYYGPTILMLLPWGTTTRIVQSQNARDGTTNELLKGIQYTIPDGRVCLVIVAGHQKPDELQASLGVSFDYQQKSGAWTHAFVPYLKFDGNNAALAKEIVSPSTAVDHIMYADPPKSDAILALLPLGTTATAMDVPDYRDSKGKRLTGTLYRLPDGKTSIVMKIGDFE